MKLNISTFLALAVAVAFVASPSIRAQESESAGQKAAFSVDFDKQIGAIKALNGINLWANFSCARIYDWQETAVACNFSTVRLHDAPWANDGQRLVDVQMIFGNLDADPADPANYFFAATDDYIDGILKGGGVPIYRLGTSIEHTLKPYFAKKPADPAKYAEVCAAIVRHYTAGWADGFEWNLPYWEIWNEPDGVPNMWDDYDWTSYCEFYVVVAKRLRSEFPNIKIGGPALCGPDTPRIEQLVDTCKETGAPLDFVSWHGYAKTPQELIDPPFAIRKLLDDKGFANTELHLNEWHYFPARWDEIHGTNGGYERKSYWNDSPEGLNGIDSAAFNDYVLTRWQDGPLDMGNYYAFGLDRWGLFDSFGKPRKTYYSMLLFGELVKQTPIRVQTTGGTDEISLIGGVSDTNAAKNLLVSVFKKSNDAPICIALSGVDAAGKVQIAKIDADVDFAEEEVEYSNGVLSLNVQKSGVYMIHWNSVR